MENGNESHTDAGQHNHIAQPKQPSHLYKCSYCKYTTNVKINFKRHEMKHTGKTITCHLCNKGFTCKYDLNEHVACIHDGQPLICSTCGKLYKSRSALSNHKTSVHGTGRYPCDKCNRSFQDRDILRSHLATHEKIVLYKCVTCNKEMFYKYSTERHHCNPTKSHTCVVCQKSFSRGDTLVQHQKTHQDNPPTFACNCGKIYAYKKSLKAHQKNVRHVYQCVRFVKLILTSQACVV